MGERFSRHAAERVGQRRISTEDLDFVLKYGTEFHKAGAMFVFMGHRNIPAPYQHDQRFLRLEGITIIISSDGEQVITAYRNREAIREIKRKLKRYQPKNKRTWH